MTVSINNDRNLIEGLLQQSQRAQQQLLSNYGSYVFAQVARLIPSQADAEEVYQDVFVRVFSHISMFDPQRSSLKTWISRIAYNESISFLRQRSLRVVSFDDHESEACAISEQEVDETFGRPNADTVQLIRSALRHLGQLSWPQQPSLRLRRSFAAIQWYCPISLWQPRQRPTAHSPYW